MGTQSPAAAAVTATGATSAACTPAGASTAAGERSSADVVMPKSHTALLNEARYAERLCERTARFYRRIQVFGTFATIVGGSATLSALAQGVPPWVSVGGAAAMTVFGALLVAMRPGERVAANEADARRYAKLRTEALAMTAEQLAAALAKAGETDTPEIEALRDVAYNDVVREIGRDDHVVPLSATQRLYAALA